MEGISLGVAAGVIHIVAYADYIRRIINERISPNAASWSIWAFGAFLESVSYIFVSGDWVKDILPIVCALCAIALFIICIIRGHFEKLSKLEWFLVISDCIVLIIWFITNSALIANILFVLTCLISFIPIFIHVYKDPRVEHALPWFMWSGAYLLMTLTVLTRWQKWEDLLYPLVFLILHLGVAILAINWRVRIKQQKIQ